jgi:hypothetical protein
MRVIELPSTGAAVLMDCVEVGRSGAHRLHAVLMMHRER